MIRSILFVGAVVCTVGVACEANATTLNVNLDLVFNDPNDMNSGGNWTVSALAGDFGLCLRTLQGIFSSLIQSLKYKIPNLSVEAWDLRL